MPVLLGEHIGRSLAGLCSSNTLEDRIESEFDPRNGDAVYNNAVEMWNSPGPIRSVVDWYLDVFG